MKDNNGMIFMLIGGAALLFWYMSQQDEDSIAPTPSAGTPLPSASKGPFPVSSDTPVRIPENMTDAQIEENLKNMMAMAGIAYTPENLCRVLSARPDLASNPSIQAYYRRKCGATTPTQNASDPIVPLPARLVSKAGTGSQTVDEWNWHYQHLPEVAGAQQPDPDTFMPEGYDRSANMSATDYVRYRGLGRVNGSRRYQAQASRIVRQSTF